MSANPNTPIKLELGVPQYFMDDTLIANSQRVQRIWLPAKIYPYPVVNSDKPWEYRILAMFGSVLPKPDSGYFMYYYNWPTKVSGVTCIAASEDGFRWNKPELGITDFNGSKANNVIIAPPVLNDGPSMMYDPDDPVHPYKAMIFQCDGETWCEKWGLYGYESSDGVNWTPTTPHLLLRAGDRSNLMGTKHNGKYRVYTRHKDMFQHCGACAIYMSESEDFKTWSEPELVLAPDLVDDPDVEYYSMSVFERNGWFLGLLEYWRSSIDDIEVQLVFSRDGRTWQHPTPREPFIAPIYEWNRKWNSCASNGPIIINEQMVFYFGGRNTSHHYDSAQQHGAIGYASMPLDRFCALETTTAGQLTTKPIEWPGGELLLNSDMRTSYESHPAAGGGTMTIEILDANGTPIPEWSGDNSAHYHGNTHSRGGIHGGTVEWPQDRKLTALKGHVIQIRFHMKNTRLFTMAAT